MKGSIMSGVDAYDIAGLQQKISEIIMQELELEPGDLRETGDFVDDYDADSLSLITILARIEKEGGVVVPQDELQNMRNLAGVFAVTEKYAKGPQGA
jgi:acyl carrier protein